MTTRLATAVIGLPILFATVWLEWPLGKPIWFAGLVFAAAAVAVMELARLNRLWGDEFHPAFPLVLTMLMLIPGLSPRAGQESGRLWRHLPGPVSHCHLSSGRLGAGQFAQSAILRLSARNDSEDKHLYRLIAVLRPANSLHGRWARMDPAVVAGRVRH